MKSISLSDAKAHLSELLDELEDYATCYVTRNGKTSAVLVNPEEWEAMRETLAILADPELMAQIRASRRSKKTYAMKDVFRDLFK